MFHKPDDYGACLDLMAESSVRTPMRILAYCLMPNHFHLCSGRARTAMYSRWMHWLMTTHVSRHLGRYRSSGHVWQGRFKAFPIQEDDHLLAVLRYIERNPLRAGLVGRAEEWRWSSLCWLSAPEQGPVRLEPGTVPRGTLWVEGVWFCLDACQRRGTEDNSEQAVLPDGGSSIGAAGDEMADIIEPARLVAFEYRGQMKGGRTRPLLVACSDESGSQTQVVLKSARRIY